MEGVYNLDIKLQFPIVLGYQGSFVTSYYIIQLIT